MDGLPGTLGPMAGPIFVVLTGAGISRESGLRTFRDCEEGLWNGFSIEEVCTPRALSRDPATVLDFYNMRRREVLAAEPNDAHLALAELERTYEVHIITQNIDDLHERAGSRNVIHIHGEVLKSRSLHDEGLVIETRGDVKLGDLAPNGEQLRPHVCFFEEVPYEWDRATALARSADIFVVIGTSLQVYPAAGLLEITRASEIVFIDPHPPARNDFRTRIIAQPASIGVREWVSGFIGSSDDSLDNRTSGCP